MEAAYRISVPVANAGLYMPVSPQQCVDVLQKSAQQLHLIAVRTNRSGREATVPLSFFTGSAAEAVVLVLDPYLVCNRLAVSAVHK